MIYYTEGAYLIKFIGRFVDWGQFFMHLQRPSPLIDISISIFFKLKLQIHWSPLVWPTSHSASLVLFLLKYFKVKEKK